MKLNRLTMSEKDPALRVLRAGAGAVEQNELIGASAHPEHVEG